MPIGGESVGNAIGGFFGGPKLTPIEYNKYLTDTISGQALGLKDLRTQGNTAADAYAAALAASAPQASELNQDTINRTGSLADLYSGYDPVGMLGRTAGVYKDFLSGQIGQLANFGEAEDKSALARMGYGGRGPSAYEAILREDRRSKNLAPVWANAVSSLGPTTLGLSQNRLASLASVIPTLQYRSGLPDAMASRTLLPYQARLSMLGSEIPLSSEIAGAAKANTAGYQQTQNKWANFFQQMGRATDQAADAYLSVYGGGMMGGGAGGGMGGGGIGSLMGGGGGGRGGGGTSSASSPVPLTTYTFTGAGAPTSAYGPYASGYSFPPATAAPSAYGPYAGGYAYGGAPLSATGPYAGGYEFPSIQSSYGGNFSPSTYYGSDFSF